MTHFKIYIKSEKLYTAAEYSEADKLYYVCGCNAGYRAEQVEVFDDITMPDTLHSCYTCEHSGKGAKVSPCFGCYQSKERYNYSYDINFKPINPK